MAKVCVNCDKKIGMFSNDPFEFDNIVLCYNCAKPILNDLNNLYYLKSKKEFYDLRNKIINKSKNLYSVDVVDSIYKKIELIYNNIKAGLQDDIPEERIVLESEENNEPNQDTQGRITENKRSIKIYTFTPNNVTAIKTITARTTYGIGLLTSIAMFFCNLFGIKCNMYAKKLDRAEKEATKELIEKAKCLGADGVMDTHCQVDNLTFLIYGTAYKEDDIH